LDLSQRGLLRSVLELWQSAESVGLEYQTYDAVVNKFDKNTSCTDCIISKITAGAGQAQGQFERQLGKRTGSDGMEYSWIRIRQARTG
jgi:hypothetical protein